MRSRGTQGGFASVEPLEARRMLAATFTMKDGRLTIDADNTSNVITVTLTPDKVVTVVVDGVQEPSYFINGAKGKTKGRVIRRLQVIGNEGDDNILIQSLPKADDPATSQDESKKALELRFPSTLIGADGDDTIVSGDGPDTLVGGSGDDLLASGLRKDVVYGSSGNDTLDGDSGKNLLIGQDDDDLLIGGRDRDVMYGMLGTDLYQPQGGTNTIYPTGSQDRVEGSNGGNDEVRETSYENFVQLYVNRLIRLTLPEQYRQFARE